MKCPDDEIKYTCICERFPKYHLLCASYDEAVDFAKKEQPDDRPYYIVKLTTHYEIVGEIN